jgi:hypothetical protein
MAVSYAPIPVVRVTKWNRGSRPRIGITVTLPKRMTSNAKADGRFGKQDFRYLAGEDLYICPAGESLT